MRRHPTPTGAAGTSRWPGITSQVTRSGRLAATPDRTPRPGILAAGALLMLITLLVAVARARSVPDAGEPPALGREGYDWAAPRAHRPDPGTLAVGVTHTRHSIDAWADDSASASARAVLTATATYQNQHIFGWGALNPQPGPGVFRWASLDRRIQLIRSTHGTPVITLCCAPDWMKGGRPGQTDWSRLEVAPRPEHYADFAALAAAVARRYPDVRHFQVWNELKGFWDEEHDRWDYQAYTSFYNVVYDALKAVNPEIAVGGPYVVVDVWAGPAAGGHPSRLTVACGTIDQRSLDVLDYWLRHRHGADFIALDASSGTRDRRAATTVAAAPAGGSVFEVMTRWLRQRTSLPVWWSEFHVGRAGPDGQRRLATNAVAALLQMADAGAAAALVWQPQADADPRGTRPPALWTSTGDPSGGRPLAYAYALARLQQVLADRADADPVSWPLPGLGLVRGRDALLFVHTGQDQTTVVAYGRHLLLAPGEVRYVARPPGWPANPGVLVVAAPTATVTHGCRAR